MYCKSCKKTDLVKQEDFKVGKSKLKAGFEMFRVASSTPLKICTFIMFALITLLGSPIAGGIYLLIYFLVIGFRCDLFKCDSCGKFKMVTKKL